MRVRESCLEKGVCELFRLFVMIFSDGKGIRIFRFFLWDLGGFRRFSLFLFCVILGIICDLWIFKVVD